MISILGVMIGFLGIIFGTIEAARHLRDRYGVLQPEVEEVHSVFHLGSSHTYTGASIWRDGSWSYIRTQGPNGSRFTVGISKEAMLNCQVGQKIVMLRQGTNLRASSAGCERKEIEDD